MVLFNRTVYGDAVNSVCCANEEAGREVARVLVESGHRRFGLIGGLASTSTHIERTRAFAAELRRHGIDAPREEAGGNTYEGGFHAAKTLLSTHDRPDALFCISDIMALGALDGARRDLSLAVPGDVSIIGFDDIAAAAWPSHDLTTVRQPVEAMIAETIAILLDQVDRPDAMRATPGRIIPASC